MAPYLTMRQAWIDRVAKGAVTWEELVGWYLAEDNAYVHKTPEYFIMGRPVMRAAGDACANFTARFALNQCDTWFIGAFAGRWDKAWQSLPYQLPFLGWQRLHSIEDTVHFMPTERIRQFSYHHHG